MLAIAPGYFPQLWSFAAAEGLRRLRRRLRAGPVWRWRFTGRTPERVLIAPPDLRQADPQIALEIYHGRFPFNGHLVETLGESPFVLAIPNPAWVNSLHGFGWLRHMHAAGTDLAAANARALVGDWIALHGRRIAGPAWEPSVTARRIIAWLQHSGVVLRGAEFAAYRAFLKSLSVQIRYLHAMVAEMPRDEERLRARIALAFAALSLPAPPSALRGATRHLVEELDRQIFPDGGHVSRNPEAVLELLADLLPLRQTYANQAEAPPEALIRAVERMLPALRFFRHQDGALARFNGMGATIHDRIAAILHHDETGGAPLLHAPHSGYERLCLGATTVIADTGAPPPPAASHRANAGCLSFEMSSGRNHFIVNCGVDRFGSDDFRPLSRATAAHSTATIDDTSQARFARAPFLAGLIGTPLTDGPRHVRCERQDGNAAQGFIATHDGYLARFGLNHGREMTLSAGGGILHGVDRIFSRGGGTRAGKGRAGPTVALRFHLHPDILLHAAPSGYLLKAPDGEKWLFACEEVEPQVEESLFFAALGGPRRSRQIVLSYPAGAHAEVHWRFVRQ